MNEFARIESIDALKTLRAFLCDFAQKISVAVDEADFEILDTFNWLKNDRYPYWKNEVRVRNERLVKAKLELKRKQAAERAMGGHDSCIDEIKAFNAAQRRFDEAQEKLKKTQSWILNFEKESFDCRGALQSLANFVRIDLVNYRTQIDNMIYSLESYVSVAAPAADVSNIPAEQYAGEEMTIAAGTAKRAGADDELERFCKDLRNRNPLRNASEIPAQSSVPQGLKQLTVSEGIREILKKNRKEPFSVSTSDKLTFDQRIESSDFIYFEHVSAAGNSGFAWYIGLVESEKEPHIAACGLADFLKEYPAMEEILALPPGWVVFAKKTTIQAVFNADNKLVAQNS